MNKITCAMFALGLTACGGGGGGSSAPAPTPTPTPDTTSPTISVTGGTSITVNQGDSFTNPSATVTDNRDTGLTAEVSGTVDTSTPDTYTLTYSATDNSGNTRSVDFVVTVVASVVQDTEKPLISFANGTSIEINQGDSFTNPTPTITDNIDTGLTAEVSGTVDTSTPDTYTLTYSATDTSGNIETIDVFVTVVGNNSAGEPVVFNFSNATTVLTTQDVAIQSGEKVVREGKGVGLRW
jgi:hypothetical protein